MGSGSGGALLHGHHARVPPPPIPQGEGGICLEGGVEIDRARGLGGWRGGGDRRERRRK